jgi:hypothetical protein
LKKLSPDRGCVAHPVQNSGFLLCLTNLVMVVIPLLLLMIILD